MPEFKYILDLVDKKFATKTLISVIKNYPTMRHFHFTR
jgi:hypothetical protein